MSQAEVIVVPPVKGKKSRKSSKNSKVKQDIKKLEKDMGVPPVARKVTQLRYLTATPQQREATRQYVTGKVRRGTTGAYRGEIKRSVELIARSLATPASDSAIRWNSQYSGMPTAVASPWTVLNAPWSQLSVTQTSQTLANTDMACAVFRDPSRAVIMYDANPNRTGYNYQFYGKGLVNNALTAIPTASWTVPLDLNLANGQKLYYLSTPYALATSGYAPHGNTWFAGAATGLSVDANARFFWIDADANSASTNIQFNINILPVSTGQITVGLSLWTPEGVNENALVLTATANASGVCSGSMNMGATRSGYYAITISVPKTSPAWTQNPIINSLVLNGAGSVYQHRCMPGYDTNCFAAPGVRVIAASAMYTDEAAVQFNQGKVAMVQSPQGTPWSVYMPANGYNLTNFSAVAQSNGSSKAMVMKKGIYGFLKPTQAEDFNIRDYIEVEGTAIVDSYYPLLPQSAYLVFYGQCTTGTGQDGYFTFNWNIDYQTTDVWRSIGTPLYPVCEYDDALELIKSFPQWHENPLHIKDIWKAITRGAQSVAKNVLTYTPQVLNAVNDIGGRVMGAAQYFV